MARQILIVDDEDLMRESLAVFLRSRGYEVITAPGPESALASVRISLPDLVLLDVGLAGADGLELLAAFKRDWPQMRVVVLTGMGGDDRLVQDARQNGADGFIVKGMAITDFMDTIQQCMEPNPRP